MTIVRTQLFKKVEGGRLCIGHSQRVVKDSEGSDYIRHCLYGPVVSDNGLTQIRERRGFGGNTIIRTIIEAAYIKPQGVRVEAA